MAYIVPTPHAIARMTAAGRRDAFVAMGQEAIPRAILCRTVQVFLDLIAVDEVRTSALAHRGLALSETCFRALFRNLGATALSPPPGCPCPVLACQRDAL